MKQYVITISRQFGSLGRPIAAKLAELLEIEYYDRDIVEKAALMLGGDFREIYEAEEKASYSWMKLPFGISTSKKQDEIFEIEKGIIEQLAAKQSCIIVGRCGDYICRDRKNAIHIHIYAPLEERLRNCVDILHMEEKDARKTIIEVDKMRDSYHKRYAGYYSSDCRYKSLLIDSSLLGINGTAKYLAELIKTKFELETENIEIENEEK